MTYSEGYQIEIEILPTSKIYVNALLNIHMFAHMDILGIPLTITLIQDGGTGGGGTRPPRF